MHGHAVQAAKIFQFTASNVQLRKNKKILTLSEAFKRKSKIKLNMKEIRR